MGKQPPKKQNYPSLQEKVKIAEQLYKDNPSKVYADALKRAEENYMDSVSSVYRKRIESSKNPMKGLSPDYFKGKKK